MSLQSIFIFFIIAAMGGITMAIFVFKDLKRPILLVALHGIFAISGICLLTYYASSSFEIGGNKNTPYASLVLFSIAAVGGLYMFFRDKYLKVGIKKWMPLFHGGAAIAGILALLNYMVSK